VPARSQRASRAIRSIVHATLWIDSSRDARRLADLQQVTDVAPAVAGAHLARAGRVEGLVEFGIARRLGLEAPGRGEGGAVAAEAGLHHAVELVDAERDRLDERRRVADAHQVAGPVGRQLFERRGERRQHLLAGLADRQPADAVAVEADLDDLLGALAPHRLADAALHDAEQRLIGRVVGRLGARAHAVVRSTAVRITSGGLGSGGHTSSTIDDVGAEAFLDVDGDLRGEPVGRAVVGALERDTVVVDLRVEREHLESRPSR
jgi:hypothetical protein